MASGEAQRGKASRAPGRTAAAFRISYYSAGSGISSVVFFLLSTPIHAYRYIYCVDVYDVSCAWLN